MRREDHIAQFQFQRYLPAAGAAMNRFMASYAGHAEQLHKTVIGQFDLLFRSIVRMQERGLLDAVHSVALSFPYSSLLCGNPRMIFGVYPDLPFLTSRLIQEIFSAPGSFRTGTHFMRTRSTGRKSWGWEPLSALRTSKSSMWDTAR